jgi:hypothetical protein
MAVVNRSIDILSGDIDVICGILVESYSPSSMIADFTNFVSMAVG